MECSRKGQEIMSVHWLDDRQYMHHMQTHAHATNRKMRRKLATSDYGQVMSFLFLCYKLSHFKAACETLYCADNICTDVGKSINRGIFSSSLPPSCTVCSHL